MKILKLTIRNFMAVGEINELPLDDKGLILIQGNNEDDSSQASNGAGKSTVAEALCWALYGETARGESGDAVINRVAKKNTEVVIELLDSTGAVYRVSRHRKHKTYKNQLRLEIQEGEGWKDLTKGTDKLTQELVTKVVGCTHEVFSSAIYAGQEAMPDLPGMTDKQLKVLVEEAAGINELQQAFEVARRIHSEAKSNLADASNQLSARRNQCLRLQANVDEFADKAEQFEKRRKTDIEAKQKEIDDFRATIDPALQAKIEAKIDEVKADQQRIKEQIAGSDDERAEEKRLAAEHQNAELAAGRAEHEYTVALNQARQAKHSYDHADSKAGSQCGECGHVIEAADLAGAKESAKKRAIETAQLAKQLKSDAEAARARATSALEALSEHRATMTDVSALARTLSDLSDKLTKLNQALKTQKDKEGQLKVLDAQLNDIQVADNPNVELVDKFKADLKAEQEAVAVLEKRQAAAQTELDVAEEAVRVFGPAGVRAHILDTVTPYLNSRTSHYLAALTDGNITAVWSTISTTAKGELREKFAIDVVSATGAETFKGLSGGEKRKVRLACAMALQDLVSSRASKPIKLFVADEIDHALDPAGLERLMTILEDKSHDKGTVLVISHTDLRDWIRNSITVTKKGGRSYLESVACL